MPIPTDLGVKYYRCHGCIICFLTECSKRKEKKYQSKYQRGDENNILKRSWLGIFREEKTLFLLTENKTCTSETHL